MCVYLYMSPSVFLFCEPWVALFVCGKELNSKKGSCVSARCNVLQCVAKVAVCCNVLQCIAVCCSVLSVFRI